MSQPQQGSQASQAEIEELMAEITFQLTLLQSIDNSVENREEAEQEVREEIKALQKKLKALQRSTVVTAPSSNSRAASGLQPSQESVLNRSAAARVNPKVEESSTSGTSKTAGSDSLLHARSPSTVSTPGSAMESYGEFLTPSKINLPTRKRSHTYVNGGMSAASDSNKSRRTSASPSPFMSRPATPSSSGDDEFEEFDKGFFQVDDPFIKQQKALQQRIKQEESDRELARRIQGLSPTMYPPASRPSAFDRMRPAASSSASSYIKPEPRPTAYGVKPSERAMGGYVKLEPRSMNAGVGEGFGYMGSTTVKAEPSSRAMPGAFVDDSSTASDSDIEIIDASAFTNNGRYISASVPSTPHRPTSSVAPQSVSEAALRRVEQTSSSIGLQHALYGSQPQPNWMFPAAGASQIEEPSLFFGMGNMVSGTQMHGSYPGGYAYSSDWATGSMQNPLSMDDNPVLGMGAVGWGQPGPFEVLNAADSVDQTRERMAQGEEGMREIFGGDYNDSMASHLDYIMNDPRRTNEEIKDLLENIKPDMDLAPDNRDDTPEGMKYPLYEHQRIALTWLKSMEESKNKGGILADDMGLGKTISSLALILSRPSTDSKRKTTLILAPVALLRQWEREFKMKIKTTHRLSVLMAHGAGKKKLTWNDMKRYDVVLTTYGTLGHELKRREKWEAEEKQKGNLVDGQFDIAAMTKLFPFLGPKSMFHRVILDEAQCIKNKNALSSRAACHLISTTRWCLTGTPMMNNVGELYSLIKFLRIRPYNDLTKFNHDFGALSKPGYGRVKPAMKKLQAVLKAILLRRTKQSQIDGKPIIVLPEKLEQITHVVFSPDEQEFYNALEKQTRLQFNKYMRAGTVGKNYSNILVLLLRLRQCCCHPHLITDFEEALPVACAGLTPEAMLEIAKSLPGDVVARILLADAFECPVCYDGVENPVIAVPCGHDTCSECLAKVSVAQADKRVADGNADDGQSTKVQCPSCRGDIDLKKVIDYKTFKRAWKPGEVEEDVETASNDDSESDSEAAEAESEVDDADGNGNLKGFIVPDDLSETDDEADEADEGDEAEEADEIEDGDFGDLEPPKKKSKFQASKKDKEAKRRRKIKKGKKKEEKSHISLAMLKKEANKSAGNRRRYMRYLKKNFEPSAKLEKCVELLEQFQNEGEKTIIFSQFVSLLDLLQVAIENKRWKCERYDGGMSADARNSAINRFTDERETKVMLISLKAGNAGLNLVAASRVIILDPFWNPFIEMQAVDRAHRIGQRKTVQVHRILIEGTVEDRIIALQERKKGLVNAALDEGAMKSLGRLDAQQLAFLFNGNGNDKDDE